MFFYPFRAKPYVGIMDGETRAGLQMLANWVGQPHPASVGQVHMALNKVSGKFVLIVQKT